MQTNIIRKGQACTHYEPPTRVSAFQRPTTHTILSCRTSMRPIPSLDHCRFFKCLSLCKDERNRRTDQPPRCQRSPPTSATIDTGKIKVNHIFNSQYKGRYLFFEGMETQMAAYAWNRLPSSNCLPVDSLKLPCKRTSVAHQTSYE